MNKAKIYRQAVKYGLATCSSMAFCLFSAGAHAENCDKYSTSYDTTYCLSKLFVESDAELNVAYKELQGVLDQESSKELKMVQRKWIKYRNSQCETSPGTINVRCSYDVNVKRTNYLKDRFRECKVGDCDRHLIASPSW
jgi:uncharacterized protein YecT (DUF1311 family)